MQDKTIDNVLRHLRRECMNGRHGGIMWVLALMHLRGVKPDFRMLAEKRGPRGARRSVNAGPMKGQHFAD